jgi:hypothetical protein
MREVKLDVNFVAHKFQYSDPTCRHSCTTEETTDGQEWNQLAQMGSS